MPEHLSPAPALITHIPPEIMSPAGMNVATALQPMETVLAPSNEVPASSVLPGASELSEDTVPRWKINQMRSQIPEIVNDDSQLKFSVGSNQFELMGTTAIGKRGAYVVESRDARGVVRPFFIYQSNSEGGPRVSQAIAASGRFMKGDELSADTQYTQSTQLHPAVTAAISELYDRLDKSKLANGQPAPDFIRPNATVDALAHDFEAQIKVSGMGSAEVDKILHELPAAGRLDEKRDIHAMVERLGNLGQALETAGLVPDFTEPASQTKDKHPVLGEITREVYDVLVNGRPVEWHMAYDGQGRVWIDRIRYGDSSATAYGTDEDMIYSGILTSKPIEYDAQATGLPDALKSKIDGTPYTDITRFLNNFEPIAKFRAQRFAAQPKAA